VRLLLDTHALLWALSAPTRLPSGTASAIRDPSNAVYVSAASAWEIAIKAGLGKVNADLDEIARSVAEVGFEELNVAFAHARRVRALPLRHRDPFDRMLIAQALEEGLTVVTRDTAFAGYGVPTAWG
jgi:PIN domain nuclease of toxin-antitoxin system